MAHTKYVGIDAIQERIGISLPIDPILGLTIELFIHDGAEFGHANGVANERLWMVKVFSDEDHLDEVVPILMHEIGHLVYGEDEVLAWEYANNHCHCHCTIPDGMVQRCLASYGIEA